MKSGFVNEDNMGLLTDLYQLTMDASYLHHNKNGTSTFEYFIRGLPKNRSYFIVSGLEQVVHYLQNIKFDEESIQYLRSQEIFNEEFLSYLKDFKFTGDVHAMPEGTMAFPNEPIIRITAPRNEAQLIETYLLNIMNFQTMIASKASRVVESAKGKGVVDFALRRTHSPTAGMHAARASYIGGAIGTSNVLAGKEFGMPIFGTMAHAYIMSFDSELEAFRAYSKTFENSSVFLIDTYDTLQGVKNAITVAKEMESEGKKLKGVRLDSGDLCELSKKVRKALDDSGLNYVKILASNDLNEYKIAEMESNGACIDMYGVGTEMGTSKDAPALSGVYKLTEDADKHGNLVAKMKLSENKSTLPGKKQVYRVFDDKGKSLKDIIATADEKVNGEPLLEKYMDDGRIIKDMPNIDEIRARKTSQLESLDSEYKIINSQKTYKVEVSDKLLDLQKKVSERIRKNGGK